MKILSFIYLTAIFLTSCSYQKDFDGWQRQSQYVEMRDRTRLAIDIYRPTLNGKLHAKPLPVIWMHTPYHRQKLDENGQILSDDFLPPLHEGADTLLKNGYAFAAVDVRGYGASFGYVENWIGPQQTDDAYDIIEWLSTQEWSDGNIGMTGRSYLGTAQYFAAASNHPALKAIFPEMGGFDNYNIFYSNGIYRSDLAESWENLTRALNESPPFSPNGVAPIDNDNTGRLLEKAIGEHSQNKSLVETVQHLPFRDSVLNDSENRPHRLSSPAYYLEEISRSQVAIYHRTGWFDLYAKDALLYYGNLDNPQKLVIGPWYHREHFGFDRDQEKLRWFDYWLKNERNGADEDLNITYYVNGLGWKKSSNWPPTSLANKYFLNLSPVEFGSLSTEPLDTEKSITRPVDYTATLGSTLERNNGLWPERTKSCSNSTVDKWCYSDSGYQLKNGENSFQFTTPPLENNLAIIGHPLAELWVDSNQSDFDIFVILEEINANGNIHFVSEGAIRASHRKTQPAPYNNFNLPWISSLSEDYQPRFNGPEKLTLELFPVANLFEKGHQIRISIIGANAGSHQPSNQESGAELTLLQSKEFSSNIVFPEVNFDEAE